MKTAGKIRRITALTRKEWLQIRRDPSSIIIAFIMPVALLLLFGYGSTLDTFDVRIGVVAEDNTPMAISIVDSFKGSKYFHVIEGRDRREFDEMLVDGRIRGIVVIPSDLTRHLTLSTTAAIQVITDGTDPNTAKFVQNYVQETISVWSALHSADRRIPSPLINTAPRYWFNQQLESAYSLVPGSIAMIMTMVGTVLTALVIAREWERGTMEAIMATPVTAGELLIGKFLPYFILGLGAMSVCLIVAVALFQVPLRGTLVALYLLTGAFLLPALGMGLYISAKTKNQFLASQMGITAGFLPAFLLSGYMFEISSMPFIIRLLSEIVPATHWIPSLQSIFLVGDIWPMFIRASAVLCGLGIALLAIIWKISPKRID